MYWAHTVHGVPYCVLYGARVYALCMSMSIWCWLCVCMPIVVCCGCCCCLFAVTHTFFEVIQSSLLLMLNETSMSVDRALQCLYILNTHTYTTHIINKTDPIVCFVFIILLSFYLPILSIYLSFSRCRSLHTKFIRFFSQFLVSEFCDVHEVFQPATTASAA